MPPNESKSIGIIGLGIIGSRIAELLRSPMEHVYVWSRSPKPIPNFIGSPAEIAELTDVIQVFVTDGGALVETIEAMADSLTKRHTIINHSTADPESVVKAYQLAKDAGAAFLDAPFTGSRDAAAKGALVYYVGGDPATLEKVRPILSLSAAEILYVGRVGEASLLKIATNMISAVTIEALSEAYGLVSAAGIDPSKLEEAISVNACRSHLTAMKLPSIIDENYEPHFSLKNMFKDSQLALSLAKALEVELPALTTTANIMFRTIQDGEGDNDYSILAKKYQTLPRGAAKDETP